MRVPSSASASASGMPSAAATRAGTSPSSTGTPSGAATRSASAEPSQPGSAWTVTTRLVGTTSGAGREPPNRLTERGRRRARRSDVERAGTGNAGIACMSGSVTAAVNPPARSGQRRVNEG